MSSRVFEAWKKLPPGPKRRVGRWWYELLSRVDTGSALLFMNHGYAPASGTPPLVLRPEEEGDRFAIGLYQRVAGAIDWRGCEGLEVSCGRGGGTAWVARELEPRSLVGVDLTRSAIRFCERSHAYRELSFRAGDAEHLDFPDETFDIVLNVESSRSYEHPERFFAEVARVLRPGGHFLFADFRKKKKLAPLRTQLAASGLEPIEEEDLSANVSMALALDAERRSEVVERRAPPILQPLIRRFAHVDDDEVRRFATGAKVYLRFVLRKPARP